MHEHREVRVTARQSVRPEFIAPDLSPVRLIDAELEKGLKGWTDHDLKIEEFADHDGRPTGLANRELAELKMGTTIRKAPAPRREVSRKRPSVRRWA